MAVIAAVAYAFTDTGGASKTGYTTPLGNSGGVLMELATTGTTLPTVKPGSTQAATSDTGLVVHLHPNSVNGNGQATMANSAPVVIASDNIVKVSGDLASGVTDTGNPQKIGGTAQIAIPTAVTAGQRVAALFDKVGKQITIGALRLSKGRNYTGSIATGSDATLVAAGAAGIFNDLYGLNISNTNTNAATVLIKDGANTIATYIIPAGLSVGFMVPVDSAITQTAAASAWSINASVTGVYATAYFVQNI